MHFRNGVCAAVSFFLTVDADATGKEISKIKDNMDKKKRNRVYNVVAFATFVGAVLLWVRWFDTSEFAWLLAAIWALVDCVLLLSEKNLIDRVDQLADSCEYKDRIINGLYEQRNELYVKIARLGDEKESLAASMSEKDDEEPVPAPEESKEVAEETEEQTECKPELPVRIVFAGGKTVVGIKRGLFVRPKDELSRWWRVRGYDTELTDPSKPYYIYIRLSHKGHDAELRFISKPRLVQNDSHRFVQIGTISAADEEGNRIVDYSLDAFRIKFILKK